ncbi:hypothetical protein NDU88_004415 [Pleurodeles waltl]|uniref:Uncharacterized protein n=1 Tax=Pleurodeles waltl TaxID=8319 RepID=A0AAV7V1Q7_PLEWA|nr:hypothetical protein NDU88_004415 [Pleurodeles waltl]
MVASSSFSPGYSSSNLLSTSSKRFTKDGLGGTSLQVQRELEVLSGTKGKEGVGVDEGTEGEALGEGAGVAVWASVGRGHGATFSAGRRRVPFSGAGGLEASLMSEGRIGENWLILANGGCCLSEELMLGGVRGGLPSDWALLPGHVGRMGKGGQEGEDVCKD